jgi:hypothetical protein
VAGSLTTLRGLCAFALSGPCLACSSQPLAGELADAGAAAASSVTRTSGPVRALGVAGAQAGARAPGAKLSAGVLGTCPVELACAKPGSSTPCSAGGAAASSTHLVGSGFDAYEGRLVVGAERVRIHEGAFDVYLGLRSDCALTTTYRIDLDENDRCDDGVDLVFAVGPGSGVLSVSAGAPGVPADCREQPGYDLELSGSCFPGCDGVHVGLFDAAGAQLASNTVDAVARPLLVFPGRVLAGQAYALRFWFQHTVFDRCNAETQAWRRSFVATAGLNQVDISPDANPDSSACFQ